MLHQTGGCGGGEDAGILGDEGIDVYGGKVVDKGLNDWKLVIVKEGIDRHIDSDTVSMGITNKGGDIVHTISCRSTSAEAGSTDIYGVSTVADSFETTFKVTGRGKELYFSH